MDTLFAKISSFGGDVELQSHWARYLCVLVAGFLETAVCGVFSEYAHSASAPAVAAYVDTQLYFFQNPKMERILGLARSFDPAWAAGVEQATEGELKDSVDSIIANRNLIAHGESVGVTYATMKRFYANAIRVIEIVQEECH